MSSAIEETLLYPFTKYSLGFLKIPGLWIQSPFCKRVVATIFITINSIVLMATFMELRNAPSNVEIIVPVMLVLTAMIAMYLKAIFIAWNKVEIQELHFSWENVEGKEIITLVHECFLTINCFGQKINSHHQKTALKTKLRLP
jgi:hypothetical protein